MTAEPARDRDAASAPLSAVWNDTLGAAEAILDPTDPAILVRALGRALRKAATRPATSLGAWKHFGAGLGRTALDVGKKVVGKTPDHSVDEPKDLRFADPAWKDSPFFYGLHRGFQVHRDLLHDLVQSGGLEGGDAAKAEFAAGLVADTLAPTNLLLTNPAALKRAFDTGGLSALRGVRNFARDLVTNQGWPSQVDRRPFRLGETIATTPGKVVFRNELIELLQYEPQTDDVNEIPLLVCPPWINRYYVADIAPGKSLIEWAVRHGHTTFAISYRNPDAAMRDVTFDDYVRLGPIAALEVARSIADADSVNLLSICLGGTMSAAVVAYLDACQRQVVNTATYINSAIDYEDAGILASVFTDPRTVKELERRTRKDGFLPGKDLAHTFDLLRANDLVFRCLVDRWLLGKDPPAFDLLAWNADSTNLPGKAHAYFIRKMYGKNALARDKLKVLGERLMVSKISIESYIVAALEDHIVPWRSSYRTTQIFKGPLRFVLTSGGHIAGIVSPPNPKARLWLNEELPSDPEKWKADAVEHHDTWWNDWADWIASRSGARCAPPSMGTSTYPILGDAPGTYVAS